MIQNEALEILKIADPYEKDKRKQANSDLSGEIRSY